MRSHLLLILFLLLNPENLHQAPIEEIRALYDEAEDSKRATEELLTLLKDSDERTPVLLAYKASATMLMAKHVGNPFKKMSYFKDGKKILKQAVDADQENVEIRFLRFAIQSSTPGFLGYKDELETDKKYLLQNLPRVEDEDLRQLILPFLKKSEYLTEEEKAEVVQ